MSHAKRLATVCVEPYPRTMRATVLAALLGLHAAGRVAAQDCYDYGEETSCTGIAGCDWLADSYCSPPADAAAAADTCYDIDEETPCTSSGCDWHVSHSCTGDTEPAASFNPADSDEGVDAAASSQPSSDPSSSNSCPAGKYYGETYSGSEMQHTAVGCIECAAGQYSDAPGQAGCIDCVANTYLDATGSDEASDCIACPDNGVTRSRARDPDGNMAGTINAAGTPSVDGCMGCADGTSYRNATHTCTPCPFPKRCVSGMCTEGAQGDGCGMCQTAAPRYYAMGQLCQPCPESTPWLFIIACTFVAASIVMLVYKVAEMHDNVLEGAGATAEAAMDMKSDAKSALVLASAIYNNRSKIVVLSRFGALSVSLILQASLLQGLSPSISASTCRTCSSCPPSSIWTSGGRISSRRLPDSWQIFLPSTSAPPLLRSASSRRKTRRHFSFISSPRRTAAS